MPETILQLPKLLVIVSLFAKEINIFPSVQEYFVHKNSAGHLPGR